MKWFDESYREFSILGVHVGYFDITVWPKLTPKVIEDGHVTLLFMLVCDYLLILFNRSFVQQLLAKDE